MNNLRPLSKYFTIFILFCFFDNKLLSDEAVDIWNINKEKKDSAEEILVENKNISNENIIQGIKIEQQNEKIFVNKELESQKIKLAGLYDPAENGLSIEMWSNSDGKEIKLALEKLIPANLSKFSEKILDIALLTNSYIPLNEISIDEFLEYKFEYLIKKKDLNLIKNFLINNPSLKKNETLIRFYSDYYLSNSELDKSCEIFDYLKNITSDYLTNFKIYCLINKNKKDEAQLLFDLKSEFNNTDNFFVKKFNFLMGYEQKDELISDKNILYFHLSHKTNDNFLYEPKIDSPRFIWKYLLANNLLKDSNLIDIDNASQVKLMERATNDNIYDEKELFNLYKRFNFDINQLINFNDAFKLLPNYQGRALLYQRLLLTSDSFAKLDLTYKLKNSFDESKLLNVFDEELSKILVTINKDQVPSNFSTFYEKYKKIDKEKEQKIKFNNKIFHQSKLLNYFLNKKSLPKTEKEANDLLKKIKKNKKYFFSAKDIMMIESLKSDGIQILKKYDRLYDYQSRIPAEINSLIVNGETGLILLKIAEIIGEDEIEDLDLDSVSFIVGIMNELKIINLRNEILLTVLPLKV